MGKGIRIKDVSKINWKEAVRYDEDSPTGLVWINPPNGVKRGRKQAGGLCTNRGEPHMARIRYKGEAYPIHRIIWFMFHGSIDNNLVIDHLDGNPWNNKFDNLFIKTLGDNARNAKMYSSNTSGIAGTFMFHIRKYLASFIKDGEKVQNESCQSCGSINVVYQEGCKVCANCGSSKCG